METASGSWDRKVVVGVGLGGFGVRAGFGSIIGLASSVGTFIRDANIGRNRYVVFGPRAATNLAVASF